MKRPFRGLRKRPPAPSYDAVVVGAGVGGLVCANLLAKAGLRVLLVEQHYMVGGYCSTFRRAGFTFDAATHFYPLLGNPRTITGRLLEELGVRTGWVKMDPVDTFHFPDGSRFVVPADFDAYLAELRRTFPEERAALDRFFDAVREAYRFGLLYFFRQRASERMEHYAGWTVRDALDRFFRDRKLKLLLAADCPHWGSPPARTSFVFDSMLRLSYFLGNYYPEGGSQAFADELAYQFEQRGGDILMSTRVERVVLRDGAACGVVARTLRGALEGPHRIHAGVVVSNADLLQTVHRLLPAAAVDPGYLEELDCLRPSFPCFLSHIGLRGVSHEALEEAQGYYWNTWDPDRVGRNGLRCKIFAPTLYEPRMAPPGGQVVILQKVQEIEFDAVDDWATHKERVEKYVFDHLCEVLPGVESQVVVRTSASAMTSQRFTLNQAGAMLGWEMSPEQLGGNRPDIRGPVANLYLTGHWTRPGGGITPVIVSALHVAEAVLGAQAVRVPEPAPARPRVAGAVA